MLDARPPMTMPEAWLATMSGQLRAARALRDVFSCSGELRYLRLAVASGIKWADAQGFPGAMKTKAFRQMCDAFLVENGALFGLDPKDAPEGPVLTENGWGTPNDLVDLAHLRRSRRLAHRILAAMEKEAPQEAKRQFLPLVKIWSEPMAILAWHEWLQPTLLRAEGLAPDLPDQAGALFRLVANGAGQAQDLLRAYAEGRIEEWDAEVPLADFKRKAEDLSGTTLPVDLEALGAQAREAVARLIADLDLDGMDAFGLREWIRNPVPAEPETPAPG